MQTPERQTTKSQAPDRRTADRRTRAVDPLQIATGAVEAAVRAGAADADAYVDSHGRLTLAVREGEIETLRRARSLGLGLRVTVNGRTALVHTTDPGGPELEQLVHRAIEIARALPEPEEPVPYASPVEITPRPHPDPDLQAEPIEDKAARLQAIERAMLSVPGVSRSGGVGYDEIDGEVGLVNARGLRLRAPICQLEIEADAIAERDGESYTGDRRIEACTRRHLLDPETMGREAGERATELLGARSLPSGRAPVLFTPHTGWALLVCLMRPINGRMVVQERSYLAGRIGERIAAPGITVRDNPLLADGVASRIFDGEGTPARELAVIEDGYLRAYLTDLASAARLGVEPGGNAVRESYDSRPEIRASNFYLAAGALSPEEILQRTDRGLLVTRLSGWWVGMSPAVDTFSSAAMGFWIEKGEKVHPVKGISIGGAMREMLKQIDLVGNDLRFEGSTRAPTFRVAEMAISGT